MKVRANENEKKKRTLAYDGSVPICGVATFFANEFSYL